jgi:type I restriction enzyme, S subunit
LEDWLKWDFDLPPYLEQRKIAEVLATWDRTIETVEALIAGSLAQTAALTQMLITGKRRLPGFDADWRSVTIAELGDTFGGLSGKSKEDFGAGFPFVTYKNVFENHITDQNQVELVRISDGENQNLVHFGDILFTTSSETPEEVGMSSVVLFEQSSLYLNSFCFGFRPHSLKVMSPRFAAHLFRSQGMRRAISDLAQGSTRYNISKRGLLALSVRLPDALEQEAITRVLDASRAELSILKGQLAALRKERAALMQQLLSGRRRVGVSESEAA